MFKFLLCAFTLVMTGLYSYPAIANETANTKLDKLMIAYWNHSLNTNPALCATVGDPRFRYRLLDVSPAAVHANLATLKSFLSQAQSFVDRDLDADHRLNRDLMIWNIRYGWDPIINSGMEGARFRFWEMPFTQLDGFYLDFANDTARLPVATPQDIKSHLNRFRAFAKGMGQRIDNMRAGIKGRMVPPKPVVMGIIGQVTNLTQGDTARAPFLAALDSLPLSLTGKAKAAIRADFIRGIDRDVTPAYRKLLSFLNVDYLPAAPSEAGLCALPNGEAQYAYYLRCLTSTSMSPKEIHELGIREVARIEAAMTALAHQNGYTDLASYQTALDKDPLNHPKDRADLLARYNAYIDGIRPELPKLFGHLPKATFVVMPVEAGREQHAPFCIYDNGYNPPRVYINTFKAGERSLLPVETNAYHEAIPGHHIQMSIAAELKGLPEFRKQMYVGSYIEGWAFYCEQMCKELGYDKTPGSEYGRQMAEMLRAVRLVVDTGFHAMQWTRKQAVDYFHAHSGQDEVQTQAEINRYMAWPGQAVTYSIGKASILQMREKAKQELGPKFSLPAFHDEVLGAGSLPLEVLEQRIAEWIKVQQELPIPVTEWKP